MRRYVVGDIGVRGYYTGPNFRLSDFATDRVSSDDEVAVHVT